MKKKQLVIMIALLFAVLLSGCRPALSTDSFTVMNIFSESRTMIYERVEKENVIDVVYDIDVDGLKVSTYCVIEFDYGKFKSESEFYADTLIPISAYKGNSYNLDPDQNWDIYAEYGKTLNMTATTSGEIERKTLELPEYYIDNEALLFTMGALGYTEEYKKDINISIIDAGEIITFRVSVQGIEEVEVPYGTVECLKVELKYTGLVLGAKPKLYIWYSNDTDRFPIMYKNGDINLRLKSITALPKL